MSDKTELETLKERADLMGISYHPNIGVEKLRDKVNAQLEGEPEESDEEDSKGSEVVSARQAKKAEIAEKRKEANRLIRCNIVCMNPNKRDWPGEIVTVGNAQIGSFRKFVQFNTEDGYHIPKIIYDALESRTFQMFKNKQTKNGVTQRVPFRAKEFSIDVLPNLTEEELAELAKAQAARG